MDLVVKHIRAFVVVCLGEELFFGRYYGMMMKISDFTFRRIKRWTIRFQIYRMIQ